MTLSNSPKTFLVTLELSIIKVKNKTVQKRVLGSPETHQGNTLVHLKEAEGMCMFKTKLKL